MEHKLTSSWFFLIGNIPESFHSADLRTYFSQLVESGSFVCFHYKHRPEQAIPSKDTNESTTTAATESSQRSVSTKCCVVLLERHVEREELIKSYSNTNWVDSNGDSMATKVRVQRLSVTGLTPHGQTCQESSDLDHAAPASLLWEDLQTLPELNPPKEMPNGNVGTPLKVFMTLIRTCKLPTHVIKKLRLEFPKVRSANRYGAVAPSYDNHDNSDVILDYGNHDNSRRKGGKRKQNRRELDNTEDESDDTISLDDDHDAEEWERYESLHNDVDKQGRTNERLFEEDQEVVWEKGGSGLVFYTDAAYWQEQEGDFDEQCSKEDDWDIDTSVYYDRTAGDRNSIALREMAVERRLREGKDDDDSWRGRKGFEKHTKGFGSKVLKKSGWMVGEGVGVSGQGISSPLEADGQHPHIKKGLGYHGKVLNRHVSSAKRKKRASTRDVIISTVYDEPDELEDTVLRSAPANTLKYTGPYTRQVKFLTGGLLNKPDMN